MRRSAARARAPFCEAGGHELTSGGRFYNENPDKRKAFVTQRRLCCTCIGTHRTWECNRVRPCKFCGRTSHRSFYAFMRLRPDGEGTRWALLGSFPGWRVWR
ncbi:hypothetical protein EVAR_47880_1 [Eumeta japonica]|uniref:Uncharacterized protein n=1 Tax=Eumeta variegata TaxID=151549 RepID=A0A4C1YC71_EUMVA|nr:hypothetical protein EVAR_47880_1 [Eumeta japonica]